MAKLSEAVKTDIVQELAMFRTPTEVSEIIRERHGVEVRRDHVHKYDPTGSAGASVSKKYKALFAATREAFLTDSAGAAVSNRAYRLRELQDLYRVAKSRGAITMAAGFLEQAAKEVGDVFTNRSKVDMSAKVTHENWLAQLPPPEQPGERTDG